MRSSQSALRILIVDDELPARDLLRSNLASHDYDIIEAGDASSAFEILRHPAIDAIVLDLGLPDMHGVEVIQRVRASSSVPIIILTTREDHAGKLAALEAGADDYVIMPFGLPDLNRRIRAAIRHRLQKQGERPIFKSGDLSVDLVRRIVKVRSTEVKFSNREYALLRLLVAHAGKVLTQKFLLREVWGDEKDAQYLQVHVRALRQKLEDNPERPQHIVTEQGIGYRLRSPD